MKEATGELNITVITIIAIAAVAGLFYAFVWPSIKHSLNANTCKSFGADYAYNKSLQQCCKDEANAGGYTAVTTNCIPIDDSDLD